MIFRRACSVAAIFCAALILSGCYVISNNVPAGSGPINDDRLVGTWQGLDSDDGEPDDVYLHFQKPEPDKPLRIVWVEDKEYQIYELSTMAIGRKNAFAAKLIGPKEAKDKDMPDGYFLGFYEFKGNEAVFRLLDSQKVGELIGRGVVKGIKPPGKYDFATLTGSPDELARFLASPEAAAALVEEPARLRRLTPIVEK